MSSPFDDDGHIRPPWHPLTMLAIEYGNAARIAPNMTARQIRTLIAEAFVAGMAKGVAIAQQAYLHGEVP